MCEVTTIKMTPQLGCALVTGGAGFLGNKILQLLCNHRGDTYHTVKVFDCQLPEECINQFTDGKTNASHNHHKQKPKVEWIKGDVRNLDSLISAVQGVDMVFHTAACVGLWGITEHEMYETNVRGTLNVIKACLLSQVSQLVFTSSFCVVMGVDGIKEGQEYPESFSFGHYGSTKAKAESYVVRANGKPHVSTASELEQVMEDILQSSSGTSTSSQPPCRVNNGASSGVLLTCVIRALSMYGEGDLWKVPSLMKYAAGGWIIRLGKSRDFHQQAYVGNVAWAHICAADQLSKQHNSIHQQFLAASLDSDSKVVIPAVGGKAYTADDDTPLCSIYDALQPLLESAGCQLTSWSLPFSILYLAGCVLEFLAWIVRPFYALKCPLNRMIATAASSDFVFNGESARKELCYQPLYTFEESIERTSVYLRQSLSNNKSNKADTRHLCSALPDYASPTCTTGLASTCNGSPRTPITLNSVPWEPALPLRTVVAGLLSLVWIPILVVAIYYIS